MDTFEFQTLVPGTQYSLPVYRIIAGKGMERTDKQVEIEFVRGSNRETDTTERSSGVLLETLLAMAIADVLYKQEIVPSEEAERIIFHLRTALDGMHARIHRRAAAGKLGSYEA